MSWSTPTTLRTVFPSGCSPTAFIFHAVGDLMFINNREQVVLVQYSALDPACVLYPAVVVPRWDGLLRTTDCSPNFCPWMTPQLPHLKKVLHKHYGSCIDTHLEQGLHLCHLQSPSMSIKYLRRILPDPFAGCGVVLWHGWTITPTSPLSACVYTQ